MMLRSRFIFAWIALASGLCNAAEAPREMHGMADVFTAPGIAIAWGIARGATDPSTIVHVRIAVDARQYPYGSASASDPFTNAELPLLAPTRVESAVNLRVPRSRYAEFPRTELRFFASEQAVQENAPALIVFYLGVPDTTPEFAEA